MRDFKFTEQERPTMANFNHRFQSIADLANGLGNEYVWLRNDGTYVNSPDTNAYPPSVSDGYTYTALGQLGSKVQIATGSYVGTGTYGASNPNSLTFEFAPALVVIKSERASSEQVLALQGCPQGQTNSAADGGGYSANLTWNEDTLQWYSDQNAIIQLNVSGKRYYYIAIG